MWIAKPLSALSTQELANWTEVYQTRSAPIAQSVDWASAIQSTGARVFLVFNPEERAGGVLFQIDKSLECINGPLLDWQDPQKCMRQFAGFSVAASRLQSRASQIILQPRWSAENSLSWLSNISIEPHSSAAASTMVLNPSDEQEGFSSRLKRTLKVAEKSGISFQWKKIESDSDLGEFPEKLSAFGKARHFFVPRRRWFAHLIKGPTLKYYLATADYSQDGAHARSEILVAISGREAHYLFGYEDRSPEVRAAISPSAWLHFQASLKVAELGCELYDFNGYIKGVANDDPYAGVCEFKKQFGGEILDYFSPRWIIDV